MRDTIIKGTGNSRYLKSSLEGITTWEQFRAALLAGTLPIDLNGVNEEGMQQLGSPLNKATLLKDNTAGLYGLTAEALPDDVLQALANNQAIIRSGYVDGDAVAAGDVVNMDDVGSVYKQISYANIVPEDTIIRNLDSTVDVIGMEDGNAVVLYSQSSGVYSIGILRASTQTVDSKIQITDVPGTSDWPAHAAIAKLDGMHFAIVSSHESTNTSSLTVTVTIYRYVNGGMTAIGTGANSAVLDNIGLASLAAVWLSETQLLVLGTFSGLVSSQPASGTLRGLLVTVNGSQITVPTTTLDLSASPLPTTLTTLRAECMHVANGTAVVALACLTDQSATWYGGISVDLSAGTVTGKAYTQYRDLMADIIRLTDHMWVCVYKRTDTRLALEFWRITDTDITPVKFDEKSIMATAIGDTTWSPQSRPVAARTRDGLIIAQGLGGNTEIAVYAVALSFADADTLSVCTFGEPSIAAEANWYPGRYGVTASARGFEASDAVLMAGTNGNGSTTSSVIVIFRAQQYGTGVAGRFWNASYMGIALEAGSNGDAIRVAYQGTIRTSLLAKDDYIDSDGVLGYSPVEGVMDVRPYWAPRAICGSYIGTGVYGSDEPNRLAFPSPPRAIFLLMGKHIAIFRRGMDYVTTATDGAGRDFANSCNVTWDYNQVLWYNSESASEQFNTANATYNYLAIM